jgi:hypothetical protein
LKPARQQGEPFFAGLCRGNAACSLFDLREDLLARRLGRQTPSKAFRNGQKVERGLDKELSKGLPVCPVRGLS